jgi:hypothetical protein
MTRNQGNSTLWQRQREGRITATVAHDIKTLREQTPTNNILKKILKQETVDLSRIKAVSFGKTNEQKALAMYNSEMSLKHRSFILNGCGLIVDQIFPIFAATPDGSRKCKCHGNGIVEVKCSYKHRDEAIRDIPSIDTSFYLEKETLKLKKNHRYYTQIQFQMYVAKVDFCDFVVYTNKGIYIQTIKFDKEFVDALVLKCKNIAYKTVIPAILSNQSDKY